MQVFVEKIEAGHFTILRRPCIRRFIICSMAAKPSKSLAEVVLGAIAGAVVTGLFHAQYSIADSGDADR